jgi:hypothetical protein
MKNLTQREKDIAITTIRLWKINSENNYVPDYCLVDKTCLTMDEKREIRDLVQELDLN